MSSTYGADKEADAKTQALIAYILMTIGLFTGVFWLLGAIWAMVKKSSAEGTLYYHHFTNMITTFWISLLLSILGSVTLFLMIGYPILFLTYIWSIYRIVKGLATALSGRVYS